jgi:UDP-N-acetyl-D-mannosaminuronic acid dehydrogenase
MPSRYQTISVIGLGYIGLPTAAAFAARKVNVIGVDISSTVVETINNGNIHIVEPELDMIVHAAVTESYLRASLVVEAADAFMIAVPTPFTDNRQPDLSYVMAAAKAVSTVLKKGDLVVLESTSPVGATEKMAEHLAALRPDLSFPQQAGEASDIRIAHCPERVLPGHVMHELVENDRIIGGMTPACAEAATALYRIFLKGKAIATDTRTAEMCKLTENAFRDVNIAFANELSIICEDAKINVRELIHLANLHPRVHILQPGCGVGGHCIAVDPWFIVSQNPKQARLIRTAREVNDSKPRWVIEQVKQAIEHCVAQGKAADRLSVACLGLAFKPDIDDIRESPALWIAEHLATHSLQTLIIVEPHLETLPTSLANAPSVRMATPEQGIENADILLALVGHSAFKDPAIKRQCRDKLVIDACGIFTDFSMEKM